MANLKAIRKRIASAKNTQKITKAMKLVSAAKLRRAQDQILAQRPYAQHLEEVISDLSARAEHSHPLLAVREAKRVELLVLTSDRGLCGGFNSNLNRAVDKVLQGDSPDFPGFKDIPELYLAIVGRKGREYHARRQRAIEHEYAGATSANIPERAGEISQRIIRDYTEAKIDAVHVVYNEFKSAISQRVTIQQLLPLKRNRSLEIAGPDYIYEPSKEGLLVELLPAYIRTQVQRALLESVASELGARMSAMDSATTNAREMIANLTLEFNRARQAAITKELMEIIGGAEALKG